MFYKLGQKKAITDLGIEDLTPKKIIERAGLKKPGEGYFGITGPGSGAIIGTSLGTSLGMTAYELAHLLGYDVQKQTGLTLPQLVALGGALGAGAGGIYGATTKE